jgi:hypothetical protein
MANDRKTDAALDAGAIANMGFNQQAGVHKVAQAGLKLKPLKLTETTHTTDFSTRRNVGQGTTLAFYNNTAGVLSVTMGDDTVTSLAVGVTNAAGKVGIPVPANSWFYTNSYTDTHAITSAAGLLGFVVEDSTRL